MDLGRFAELGAQIAEKSLTLKDERAKAAVILKGIKTLEDELRPLVIEHTKCVAEMVGSSMPTVVVAPAPQPQFAPNQGPGPNAPPAQTSSAYASHLNPFTTPLQAPVVQGPQANPSKARIRNFLQRATPDDAEGGLSAASIAEQLGVDPALVREVIRENMTGRR